ncbi:MAG: DUF721 domain-containing protein [Gammaproteobacteria bacterium]|nr:DUF721 domain-containing protein [Gammaproteobacteria bacterium]
MRPAKQIYKLLTSSKQAKGLLQRVAHNKQLTSIMQASLPSPLASFCQTGTLTDNRLTIITSSPVWAAKLRYLLPALLKQLQTHKPFSQVTEINIKISNITFYSEVQPKQHRKASMSPHSADIIQQTANSVNDKALRESLLRLSLHGKKPEKPEQ